MFLAGVCRQSAAEPFHGESELLAEMANDIAVLARQEKALMDEIKALSAATSEVDADKVCLYYPYLHFSRDISNASKYETSCSSFIPQCYQPVETT